MENVDERERDLPSRLLATPEICWGLCRSNTNATGSVFNQLVRQKDWWGRREY